MKTKSNKRIIQTKVKTFEKEEDSKIISANDLPNSLHKSRMAMFVSDMKSTKLCVIAFRRHSTAWEAFVGYPDIRDLKATYKDNDLWETYEWCCENVHDVHQVTIMGEKLSREDALVLFPDWSVLTYF